MSTRLPSQDVGWRYGTSVGERRGIVKCNYCDTVFRGGITRFKDHFVRKGGRTGPCASAPDEVREMILSEAERKQSSRAASGKLDAGNKRAGKIMTRSAKVEPNTSRNVQPEFVSDPSLCIPSKERGICKRKLNDSKQEKKLKTSGNAQTEFPCNSHLSVPSMEQDIRKRNTIYSKQQKMLTTCGNVQSEPASNPPPCIPFKGLGSGKRRHRDSEQQKKIRTSGNVRTVSASDPLGIPPKEMDSGKRKQIGSEPQKKIRTSGNVQTESVSDTLLFISSERRGIRTFEIAQTESVFDSSQCTASKEGTGERKDMDSKQQKKRGRAKEDTMQSFHASFLPRYTLARKLRGIKERKEQKKLDTNAFESFLEHLWSKLSDVKRKTCTYLDCLWFSLYMKRPSQSKVLTWIKKKQIFSRKYVFVPIIRWRHWSLLILCHFGESFMSKAKRPCMLLLDSLGNINPMRLEPDIRRFVFDIYKSEGCEDEKSIPKIPLLLPKVPQQRDGEKCGIFALYFIRLFLRDAPEAFNQEGYPYFLTENWFSWEEMENFHKEVLHFTSKWSSSV